MPDQLRKVHNCLPCQACSLTYGVRRAQRWKVASLGLSSGHNGLLTGARGCVTHICYWTGAGCGAGPLAKLMKTQVKFHNQPSRQRLGERGLPNLMDMDRRMFDSANRLQAFTRPSLILTYVFIVLNATAMPVTEQPGQTSYLQAVAALAALVAPVPAAAAAAAASNAAPPVPQKCLLHASSLPPI